MNVILSYTHNEALIIYVSRLNFYVNYFLIHSFQNNGNVVSIYNTHKSIAIIKIN